MAINLIRKASAEMPSTAFNPLTEQWTIGPNAGGVTHSIQGIGLVFKGNSTYGIAAQLAILTGGAEADTNYAFVQSSDGTADLYGLGINGEGNHLIIGGRSGNTRSIFFVNGNPTRVQVGKVNSTGAWTLGPTAFLASNEYHQINGSAVVQASSTIGSISNSTGIEIGSGFYQSAGNVRRAVSSVTGYSFITIDRRTVSGQNAFEFTVNYQDAQTAGQPLVTTNNRNVGIITVDGSWRIGSSNIAAGLGEHIVYGNSSSDPAFQILNAAAAASSANTIVAAQYTVDTDCTGGYFYLCRNSAGTTIGRIEATANTTTAFTGTSDSRLKSNPSNFSGLNLVMQMQPKEFEWVSNPGLRSKGFYAQELYEIYPEAVSVGSDELTESGALKNPWGIDYGKLTPVLVKALQELKQQFDDYVAAHP
jgi:hypothetical protein